MRIAIVTETWYPHVDGVITRLSATIRTLNREGHAILVVAPEGGQSSFEGAQVRGLRTFRVPFVYGGQPWGYPLLRQVGRYLDEFDPDVVHVVNPIMLGIAGVVAARKRGLPLVCSYHTDVSGYAGHYHLGWLGGVIRRMTRALHSAADINLATSSAACHRLRSLGVSNVHLWRRGVDTELFRPQRYSEDPPRWRRGERDQVVALNVGRISKEKGLGLLEPLARDPEVMLVFVGDGPAREQLQHRFSGMNVCFTGTLHGTDLADAYASANVFVFPSMHEVNPLVLLEAMAAGLPVVAVDSLATRELLQDHPRCRLFPVSRPQVVPQLVADLAATERAEPTSQRTRHIVDGLSWSAATRQLLRFYHAALRSSASETEGEDDRRRAG